MLKALIGSEDAERVLLFLLSRQHGYCREIADFRKTTQTEVKRQLVRLASPGVVLSR